MRGEVWWGGWALVFVICIAAVCGWLVGWLVVVGFKGGKEERRKKD